MANLRDLPNPSGADIEAYVNQQILKSVQNQNYGQFGAGHSFKAADWDIQVTKANQHPGQNWEFVQAVGVGIDCFLVWRMSRAKQAELNVEPIMKSPTKPA